VNAGYYLPNCFGQRQPYISLRATACRVLCHCGPSTCGNLAIMFDDYLERWELTPDGEPIITPTSRLLPVRMAGVPAMLKIAVIEEERLGGLLMNWWNGHGVARVLAHGENAILMERAEDGISLAEVARNRRDDEASRTICAVLAQLHAPRGRPPPALVPLTKWFEALGPAAEAQGGILRVAATTASHLLTTQREVVVLHGDMHHGNVLDFGSRGWLAIDPKGLIGERYFDYANIFCNPDGETATMPGRLPRQIRVVAQAACLEPSRLLAWVVAWCGLSAAFLLDDGLPPDGELRVAELAAVELNR
jgi:streptomycin 6-kinase